MRYNPLFLPPMTKPYNCDACPAYCCGYPRIAATAADIRRIARHLKTTIREAREAHTEDDKDGRGRILRRRKDEKKFGAKVCVFLDQQTRRCGIYRARPQICRDYPGDRCEWFDRATLEKIANGKKVVLLKKMPWTINEDHPEYTLDRLPQLVEEYARRR